jgi:alkanesulfonate monooxygenase SsuD/methylene tetrahydromethanopterin reductase-like flavin-dependent oxidoreductase (luciferase family)
MFSLRFDMRAPRWGAAIEDLYSAAIDMAEWAEDRGAVVVVLSEHHGTEDRHLPSPIVLASAIAARTQTLSLMVAAAVLPFYDPVRLAEDMAVVDIISRGRVSYVLGVGHRSEEYQHFGLEERGRGARADAELATLIDLLAGELVTGPGRSTRITPTPASGGPQLFVGGGSLAAARRAGRFGLGLIAQAAVPGLQQTYEQACLDSGHEPGFVQIPRPGATTTLFVADDVDGAWDQIGRHLLHDAVTAASYRDGESTVASISSATSIAELRDGRTYRIVTLDEAVELVRAGSILPLVPLCGGLAPEVAWTYLRRAAQAVELAHL